MRDKRQERLLINTWQDEDFQKQREANIKTGIRSAIIIGILMIGAILAFKGCAVASDSIHMPAIIQIESGGKESAFNANSGAVGLCQITPVVLKEYNLMVGADFKRKDLFNGQVNLKIATWYMNRRIPQLLKHYGIADTLKNRLWAYNAGIGKVRRGILPLETRNYIKKYNKITKGA